MLKCLKRPLRIKKALFGIPSMFSLGFITFFSYVYYTKFLPELQSLILQVFFFTLHTLLAFLTIWSLLKTLLSDPGYVSDEFKCEVSRQQEEVKKMNREHFAANGLLKHIKRRNKKAKVQGKQVEGLSNNDYETEVNPEEDEREGGSDSSSLSSEEGSQQERDLATEVSESGIPQIAVVVGQNQESNGELAWEQIEREVDENFNVQTTAYIRYRYCHKCNMIKPPRTHHCSICDACVMRMDHHCPWVGNCVGILNHKYFWNFLLWAFLGTLQVSIVLVSHRGFDHIGEDFFYLIASVMSFAFLLSIGALLAVHTYMIAHNLSTIESQGLDQHNPFKKEHHDEHASWWQKALGNAELTLGMENSIWRWLLPLTPRERVYSGTHIQLQPDPKRLNFKRRASSGFQRQGVQAVPNQSMADENV